MSGHDAFERILASLHDAMLDDVHWPTTTALIDEACGLTSNALQVGEGPKDDLRVLFVGLYCRGQRRENLERKYLEVYRPIDERVPTANGRHLQDTVQSNLTHNDNMLPSLPGHSLPRRTKPHRSRVRRIRSSDVVAYSGASCAE